MGAVTDFGIKTGVDAVLGTVFLAGEVVEEVSGSSSVFLGDFFFSRITSVPSPSALFCWTCSVCFLASLASLLMVAVEAVGAAVSVAAAAFGRSFLGQNFEMCPSCLQLQQRGRLPSTTTICLSLLIIISGIAWKLSRVRHSWNPLSP